jgi:glutamate 5-kinase
MRVVAKIGSSSLTDELGVIQRGVIADLCRDVATLHADGHEVLVVSSGAVSAGVAALGMARRPTDVPTLQALAAAGQPRLMEVYVGELASHGVVAAQALVDPHDFVDRRQYLHARQTLVRLLELGCVPVINENDAIASDELRYGDNDRLAALVAHSANADVLVLLTDLDGLFTADPRTDANAALVPFVGADTIGTTFEAHGRKMPARKLWIAFASQVVGAIVVDDGARRALTDRPTSLLPAGVVDVVGSFGEGDTVDVQGLDGAVFARGMVFVDSDQLRRVAGLHTRELPDGVVHEVIHRDDLVVLPS